MQSDRDIMAELSQLRSGDEIIALVQSLPLPNYKVFLSNVLPRRYLHLFPAGGPACIVNSLDDNPDLVVYHDVDGEGVTDDVLKAVTRGIDVAEISWLETCLTVGTLAMPVDPFRRFAEGSRRAREVTHGNVFNNQKIVPLAGTGYPVTYLKTLVLLGGGDPAGQVRDFVKGRIRSAIIIAGDETDADAFAGGHMAYTPDYLFHAILMQHDLRHPFLYHRDGE
ncbi:hypothetical protein H9P43_003329 [Blastocladiella emersonii ATCC 22665]|nr:hypothetical protein H9P43_003329 [Blastocladiella emersonii ATCC 22665]